MKAVDVTLARAFWNLDNRSTNNTVVMDGGDLGPVMFLHSHKIAWYIKDTGILYITFCGYPTLITAARLNGVLSQRNCGSVHRKYGDIIYVDREGNQHVFGCKSVIGIRSRDGMLYSPNPVVHDVDAADYKRFSLTIDMDGAAFEDPQELVRILGKVAREVEAQVPSPVNIRDYNGNRVGSWSITQHGCN